MAPSAQIATPAGTEADERQVLVLDAGASNDPEGDTLTFQWTQLSGPAAVIATPKSTYTEVQLPEVSQTADIGFRLTVSDGTNSTTATQILRARNIDLQPTLAEFDVSTLDTIEGRPSAVQFVSRSYIYVPISDLIALRQTVSGTVEFLLRQINQSGIGPDHTTETRFSSIDGNFNSVSGDLYGETSVFEYAIASEDDNVIQLFERSDETPGSIPSVSTLSTINVQRPCSLGFGLLRVSPSDPALSTVMVVGRRSGGIQLFAQGSGASSPDERKRFDRTVTVTSTGTFCEVASLSGNDPPTPNSFLTFLVGIDTDSNRIRTFVPSEFVNGTTGPLTEWDFTPIQRGTGSLEIVDTVIAANNTSALEVAVLLSDGAHDGQHMLEVYRWTNIWSNFHPFTIPTGYMTFDLGESLTWEKGRPKSVMAMDMNGDALTDYIVLLESAPYLLVYLRDYDRANQSTVGFTGPHYIEVGFDFDEMTPRDTDVFKSELVLTRQQNGELVSVLRTEN
ncbi:hypothetical protein BBF93_16635 [Hyphomonas sp. CACIAM 19H1]|uniref:PKD domain-containing protein n=1 Tax=Hyphomonas sp. CACIAM 19H1 TaxID=1873716 RepID=UPI000DEDAB20|nr:hypothetical protein [Hyphomonas sp. CACIAM 19H1]AXE65673.1 hypothetical protein BBF93_16635 [Hyphomonas sp. CACIAM 19H1]